MVNVLENYRSFRSILLSLEIMEVATTPDTQTDAEKQRAEFESFLKQKFMNLQKRLTELFESSDLVDETQKRLIGIIHAGVGLLLDRSQSGELNALMMTAMIFQKYYNPDTDEFNMNGLIEESVESSRLMISTIIEKNPDHKDSIEFHKISDDFTLYDTYKSTDVFNAAVTIAGPYLKMLCQLALDKKK